MMMESGENYVGKDESGRDRTQNSEDFLDKSAMRTTIAADVKSKFVLRGNALRPCVAGDRKSFILVEYFQGSLQSEIQSPSSLEATISNEFGTWNLNANNVGKELISSPSLFDTKDASVDAVMGVKFFPRIMRSGEYDLKIAYFGKVVASNTISVVAGPPDPRHSLVLGPYKNVVSTQRHVRSYIVLLCDRFQNPILSSSVDDRRKKDVIQAVPSGSIRVTDVRKLGPSCFVILYEESVRNTPRVARENAALSVLLNGMPVCNSPVFPLSAASSAALLSDVGVRLDRSFENEEIAAILCGVLKSTKTDSSLQIMCERAIVSLPVDSIGRAIGKQYAESVLRRSWTKFDLQVSAMKLKDDFELSTGFLSSPVLSKSTATTLAKFSATSSSPSLSPRTQQTPSPIVEMRPEPFDVVIKLTNTRKSSRTQPRRRKKKKKQRVLHRQLARKPTRATYVASNDDNLKPKLKTLPSFHELLRIQEKLDAAQAELLE